MNLLARVAATQRYNFGASKDADSKRVNTPQRMLHACFCVLVSTVGLTGIALPQLGPYSETTSTPIPTASHSFINNLNETVNPENGALSIRITAPAPKERGLDLPITIYAYDSNGQSVLVPNWAYSDSTNSEYITDIRFQAPSIVGQPNTIEYDTNPINSVVGNRFPVSCTVWYNFLYTDASANRHPLSGLQGTSNSQQEGCQGLGISASAAGQQGGDDVYTGVYLGNGASVAVFDNDGNALAATAGVGLNAEDRNGNLQYASGRSYSFGSWLNTSLGGSYSAASIPDLAGTYAFSASVQSRGSTVTFPFNATLNPYSSTSCPTSFIGTAGGYSGTGTLSIPNGQQYSFSIDPTFGLVNHIKYPTGAAVDYVWETNSQSEQSFFSQPSSTPSDHCAYTYDWPAVQKRTLSLNGVATQEQDYAYTTTYGNGLSGQWTQKSTTVTIKDLATSGVPSYKVVYTYTAAIPSTSTPEYDTVATYDGTGALLNTITKVLPSFYNNKLQGQCATFGSNGPTSATFYGYSARGIAPTDKSEYDYGIVPASCQQPSSGSPTRETATTFHNFGTSQPQYGQSAIRYAPSFLFDRPDSVKVYGSGALAAETDYTYDDYATSAISATNHDETYYSSSSLIARGNATSVTRKCFVVGGSACVKDSVTYIHYDETGQPIQVQDPNGNKTLYSYTDNYTTDNGSPNGNTNILLTTLTRPPTNGVAHVQTFQYGFNDGKVRVATDENGQQTQYCYTTGGCSGNAFDPWFRLTQTKTPDHPQANPTINGGSMVTYNDAGPSPTVGTTVAASPDPDITTMATLDGMGRTVQTQLQSDPDGTIYTASTYNGFGQLASVSNPSRCAPGGGCTETTAGTTQYQYDSLGRPTSITYPDGYSKSWRYGAGTVDRYDENSNHWQDTYDGLGRLASVLEADSLLTIYSYDALDNLTCVNQLGQNSGLHANAQCNLGSSSPPNTGPTARVRAFTYDSLSRLVTSTNPESGTTTYTYDPNGNVITRTDARGIVTTYGSASAPIDALNRVVQKSYSDNTPPVTYQYDKTSSTDNINTIGRLTGETVQRGSAVLFQRVVPEYDPVGRIAKELRCVPSFCGSYLQDTEYTYDAAGNEVTSYTNETTLAYGYDGAGRMTAETIQYVGGQPGILMEAVHYSPFGAITSANGFENRTYDKRGRAVNVNYSSTDYALNYNANYDYYPNGNLNHTFDYVIGNFTYNYDNLNRLTSAVSQDPTVGTQSYTYDTFGDRLSQSGVLSHSATYNNVPNRIDCSGSCYDASGNLLQDVNTAFAPHSYTYDAEGRLSGVTDLGYQYFYDGEGTRVAVLQNGAIARQYFWDAKGQYYYVYKADNGWSAMEFFGAGRHIFNFSTADYLPVLDAQGTERSRQGFGNNYGSNGFTENCSSLPYGDGLQCSNQDVSALHFTGKERDTESQLDYFRARHYASSLGRFMSPDPSGLKYADPKNPQSLNLYSYVLNNPVTFIDPTGLTCVQNSSDNNNIVDDGDGKGCSVVDDQNAADVAQHRYSATVYASDSSDLSTSSASSTGTIKRLSALLSSFNSSLQLGVCTLAAPLLEAASLTHSTLGIGGGASAGAGFILGVSASGGIQVAADQHGNLGVVTTSGGNPGFGVFGVGASAGVQGSVSSADTIFDLGGGSVGGNASSGPFGVDVSTSDAGTTFTGSAGVGVGTRASGFELNASGVLASTHCTTP